MITYEYECKACGANFDIQQSIKDEPFTWCPECEAESLRRILHPPLHVSVTGTTNITLGGLAERNARNMSADQMHEIQQQYKTKKTINRIPEELRPKTASQPSVGEQPEWIKKPRTKTTDQVIKMTPSQVEKYVATGN